MRSDFEDSSLDDVNVSKKGTSVPVTDEGRDSVVTRNFLVVKGFLPLTLCWHVCQG
jgi:hypothetical protein